MCAPILRNTLVVGLLCLFSGQAFAAIGMVRFAFGDARIRDAAGQVRAMQKGDAINEGDTVLTGAGASAQLKMSDGGILAVRPETELKIDTYRFAGKEDGTENALLALVKGGFRTLTGIIGKTNKDNYKIATPTATIGIRGTDHEPIHIPPVPVGAPPPPAPPGDYDKVNVGQAFIRNSAGEIAIRPNQVGYAAPNQTPTLLPRVPEMFKVTPPVREAQPQRQKEAEQQKQAAQGQPAAQEKQAAQEKEQAATKEQQAAQQKQTAAASAGAPTSSEARTAVAFDKGAGRADTVLAALPPAAAASTASATAMAAATQTVQRPITAKLKDAEDFGINLTTQTLQSTGSGGSKRGMEFAAETSNAAKQAEDAKAVTASILAAARSTESVVNAIVAGASGLSGGDVAEVNSAVNAALTLAKQSEDRVAKAASSAQAAAAAAKKAEATGDLSSVIAAQTALKSAKTELDAAQDTASKTALELAKAAEFAIRVQSGSSQNAELSKAQSVVASAVATVGQAAAVTTSAQRTIVEGKKSDDRDLGLDARWGRWEAGQIDAGAAVRGSGENGVAGLMAKLWRSIVAGMEPGPVVLPVTGTAAYQLVNATAPIALTPGQTSTDVGTLGGAALTANFTAKTVDVAVNASTPGSGSWTASANGVPILTDTTFVARKAVDGTGNLAVTRNGSAENTAGRIAGAFRGASGGSAALGYVLNQNGPTGVTLSGVAAFKRP